MTMEWIISFFISNRCRGEVTQESFIVLLLASYSHEKNRSERESRKYKRSEEKRLDQLVLGHTWRFTL